MYGKRLFIYCAGGLGRDFAKLARVIQERQPRWDEIVFLDDHAPQREVNGVPVWSFEEWKQARRDGDAAVVASGEPRIRRALAEKLLSCGGKMETLLHPDFYCSAFNAIGAGSVITEGNVFADNITVGNGVVVNLRCIVGHNAQLGDFSTLSPGCIVSGDVTIGAGTYIGTGAVIRDEVKIGKNCIIGMGSLVTGDIPDNVVAYGSPCRVVRENTDGIVFR